MDIQEVDLEVVKTRTVTGILTLISRAFFIRIVSVVGLFLLTVYLGRPEIGLFIAVNDLVSILGYFSDIGLAASLVQKKSPPERDDLRSVFTIQQSLVSLLIILVLIFSPRIIAYYHIPTSGVWLLYSLVFGFFLSSLKTIPSILLERELRFNKLALVEVVENLVFYLTAVWLAATGHGVAAYAWAVFLRSLLGTLLLYRISPWDIGLGFSRTSFKHLLPFGFPYQINTLMAVIKDRFLNIVLWKIIGADGVGIIGWAQNWSSQPLRFIMDNVTKVTFPSFSRLQHHQQELKNSVEKTLLFINILSFPFVAALTVLAPVLVAIIPKYQKWEVALLPLSLYCLNTGFAAVSTPLTNTFNAIGKVKLNTVLMVMWTVLAWTLTPFLAYKFGYLGVAYATAIISFSSLVPMILAKKYLGISYLRPVVIPAFAAIIPAFVVWQLTELWSASISSLIILTITYSLLYLVILLIFLGHQLVDDSRKMLHVFRKL